jgi:hypothetical protein
VSCSLLALSGKQPCKECIGQTRPHITKEPHPSGHIELPLMAGVDLCYLPFQFMSNDYSGHCPTLPSRQPSSFHFLWSSLPEFI